MLIVIIVLILVFLLNFLAYWIICLNLKLPKSESSELYKKIFPIIWIACVNFIPFINSSFFKPFFNTNISYFHQYWLWFALMGLIIIIFGIKINSLAIKLLKTTNSGEKTSELIRKGVFEIVRHPQYFSWFIINLGITFIFDSFIGILFSPILFMVTEILCIVEEKYLLFPKFRESYSQYTKKTPYRLISPPYNYLFIIIGILVGYIGLINFFNI